MAGPYRQVTGTAAPRFRTRFILLAQEIALKSVRVSVLGVPVGGMTAVHRRVAS